MKKRRVQKDKGNAKYLGLVEGHSQSPFFFGGLSQSNTNLYKKIIDQTKKWRRIHVHKTSKGEKRPLAELGASLLSKKTKKIWYRMKFSCEPVREKTVDG